MKKAGVALQSRSTARQRAACLQRQARGAAVALAAIVCAPVFCSGGFAASAQVLQPHDLTAGRPGRLETTLQPRAGTQPVTIAPQIDGDVLRNGPDGLPAVLSARDAELYRQIFTVQEDGHWAEADRLIAQLSDRRLMGHVLAQRYLHPTAYRSKYVELKDWMDSYADLPEAKRI